MTPPPAFAWDDWYAMVGGRSIRIPEVDDFLRRMLAKVPAAQRRALLGTKLAQALQNQMRA